MVSLATLLSLFECTTEDAWSTLLFSIMQAMDIDYVLYCVVLNKLLPLQNGFIKSNYPEGWRHSYRAANLHFIDPTVSHCLNSSVPIIWQSNGVSLPAHGANGEFGMLHCATDRHAAMQALTDDPKRMADLTLVRDYIFESSLKFVKTGQAGENAVKLTKRERECLSWIMIGKSSWEISKILNCAEATINFHIGNIKGKFNVRTRQQAVAKAIMAGVLTPG